MSFTTRPSAEKLILMKYFLRRHGLSIVVFGLFAGFWVGQTLTGMHIFNEEQRNHKLPEATLAEYLRTGHFVEATAENLESEFLSIGCMVVLAIFLRQRGSPESKPLATPHWENE